ncbi:LuxR C-terminal-related transcriptional regulator [Microvirga lotononidis]|uniref:Response regulator containing a CheY-like receiver domain and an HTH DNA-binding domain n=1 Tax=Microvirga lotononidis TaxID=864069 RepID=I4YLG2_9HYPH|nr:response regulator transcription factor [Microvirga lotononidis]EIM24804.1 response regulator containing a CheY-like receiver domain and an HTH DNA-binding domain [Microvirga lotononidis]WQO29806.1 response regulator transcription factor [Microvirga lotononidis]
MKVQVRVGVIDRHPLFRDGVTLALNSQSDIKVVAQGASVWDAIDIAQRDAPDVIVLDADVLDRSMGAVESILQHHPAIRIVILADAADEEHVYGALKRGVRGYLLKGTCGKELIQTVRVLDQGQSFISPSLAARLLMRSGPGSIVETKGSGALPPLTPREQQILAILVQGRSNKEIGNKLELSEKTIKHHLTNILQKLRVRNRVEAALLASNHLPQSVLSS